MYVFMDFWYNYNKLSIYFKTFSAQSAKHTGELVSLTDNGNGTH